MARILSIFIFLPFISITASAFQAISGDSQEGCQLIRDLKCTTCHSLKGEGAAKAPDLGRTVARNYSPSYVAGQFWSHAPAVWSHLSGQGIPSPQLTEEQAAALFAYFASARYFEPLGDARRGKQIFRDLQCDGCHATRASNTLPAAKAVPSWGSLDDPLALACILVNPPDTMTEGVAAGRSSPARLTSQGVTDLLLYLRYRPETRGREIHYSLPASAKLGRTLFEAQGCGKCHIGELSLERRDSRLSLSGFIAAMWNHNPRLKSGKAGLTDDNLKAIAGYLWSIGLFDERGDPSRGERLYTKMGCGSCHDGPGKGASTLKQAQQSGQWPFCVYITAGIWNHGPDMLEHMRSKGIAWPHFTGSKLADLAAYLQH
jgi:cytochrome c2